MCLFTTHSSYAQSGEEESIEFSGSVDTYFRTNLGGDKFDAPASSFANLNGFALGMVNIKAEQSTAQGGFVADLYLVLAARMPFLLHRITAPQEIL